MEASMFIMFIMFNMHVYVCVHVCMGYPYTPIPTSTPSIHLPLLGRPPESVKIQ